MKIAVAMLCHKNVEQINSLLRAMENENISFFIHVDRKSTISRHDISGNNVTVIPMRMQCGYSMGRIWND